MPEKEQEPLTVKEAVDVTHFALGVLAMILLPLIRRDLGYRTIGLRGLIAFVVLLASCHDQSAIVFTGIWFFVVAQRQWLAVRDRNRGVVRHSMDEGYPEFGMQLVRDLKWAAVAEEAGCAVLGVGALYVSPSLCGILLTASLALVMKRSLEAVALRERVRRMTDAEIETKALMSAWRDKSSS